MEKQESDKKKTTFRWFIPLLATIPFVIWESTAFGFNLAKYGLSFMLLFVIYNALMSWIQCPADKKPSPLMLIACIPLLIALMLVILLPYPYVLPWFITIITSVMGFEFWLIGIGYWIQETKLKRLCTGRAVAAVIGNVMERIDNRPGEISPYTYYPILAYTVNGAHFERQFDHGQPRPMELDRRVEICYNPNNPEEFCFLNKKENKALTIGVPFAIVIGTGALIATVISLVLK